MHLTSPAKTRAGKMLGARLSAVVALLLVVACSQLLEAQAQEACKEEVLGQSSLIGSKQKGSVMVDHTPLADNGPITRVTLYYNRDRGCLQGAKAAFGSVPVPGMVGNTAGATEKALKLEAGEVITKAEYKAGKCIEFLKLTTSKGRSVSAGRVGPVADLMTSAPTAGSGQLLAIKGSSKPNQGKKQGALQHLQLVWGTSKCSAVSTAASTEGALMPESGTLPAEVSAAGACKPRVDMCNEKASMNAFTYCIWNTPFSGPSCKGGCCFSSGKCASSSCAISGMGRDVPNMICYGINSGVGFGGNSNCAGLACKLATPGCSTDAFGGNCVGTVVALGSKEALHPESLKYVGAPCLDATPSDTTLNAAGEPASGEEGVYMGKLWTVCDCSEGGLGLPEPASRLLNLTTTRISNFTKNEVLAALSTFLPQKNVTDEADPEGQGKVVTLLPSFADMFKMPSLSSISLPSFLGNLTGSKAGKDGALAPPKLPDLPGLLGQIKPLQAETDQAAGATPGLNFESAAMPNGTAGEMSMVETPGAAPEKPPRTLGSLLSMFTKPKEASNADGSSTFTPGSTEADKSAATKAKPMTLGSLFGGLRRAGPDNSTAAASGTAAPAGNGTRKLDLSPISALITKFINGPSATPPAAPATMTAAPAAATATPAPASSAPAASAQSAPVPAAAPAAPAATQQASAVKLQSATETPTASGPASGPAAAPPRGPAMLSSPGKKTIKVGGPAIEQLPDPLPDSGAAADVMTDANGRPLTLAERLRAKKAARDAAKADAAPSSSSGNSTAEQPAGEVQTVSRVRKQGFTANVALPPLPRPEDDPIFVATGMNTATLMYNLLGLTEALRAGVSAGADDLMQFSTLLAQLSQVPGGLAALPADVSAALMTLAAEVNKVNSGEAAAPAPAPAAEPTQAENKQQQAPAAAPAAAAAKPEEQPAKPTPSQPDNKQQPVKAPAPASAPVPASPPKEQPKAEQASVKASVASAVPATTASSSDSKEQHQAKQPAPAPASSSSSSSSKAAPAVPSSEAPKAAQQPKQPAAVPAAAAVPSVGKDAKAQPAPAAISSNKEEAKPAATAQPASKPAAASNTDSQPAKAAEPKATVMAVEQPSASKAPVQKAAPSAAAPAAGKAEAAAGSNDSKPAPQKAVSPSQPAAAAAAAAAATAAKPQAAAAAAADKPASKQ